MPSFGSLPPSVQRDVTAREAAFFESLEGRGAPSSHPLAHMLPALPTLQPSLASPSGDAFVGSDGVGSLITAGPPLRCARGARAAIYQRHVTREPRRDLEYHKAALARLGAAKSKPDFDLRLGPGE